MTPSSARPAAQPVTSVPSALSIAGLRASYGKVTALDGIDLTVEPGEIFGLVGLNGAGKTTLVKCMLGLRKTGAGQIHLLGRSAGSAEAKKHLAYLPERFDPPWFLTGAEFLRFSQKLYGAPLNEDDMLSMAADLALDPAALSRTVQSYSKGMRQKLGLMSCFLSGAAILILDEPMSGLDPAARLRVKRFLTGRKKEGQTVFFSSHILGDMEEICGRIAVLFNKKINFTGTPSDFVSLHNAANLEKAFLQYIEEAQKL